MRWERLQVGVLLVWGTLAIVGLVAVLVGVDALWQGEVLHFLPTGWRTAFEAWLGLPTADAHVERSWRLASALPLRSWHWWPLMAALGLIIAYLGWTRLTRQGWRQGLALMAGRLCVFGLLIGIMLPGWT